MSDRPAVLLTGATGFIAKHICLRLLGAGYDVVGTTRDRARIEEMRAAVTPALADPTRADAGLRLIEADLLRDAGWAEAMEGVGAVIHCASPFPMAQPRDPQAVIAPAVEGTLRVLHAAHAAEVARVVLTSSVAAILYRDKQGERRRDETDWTDTTHPAATPYTASKTLAERAAWDFAEQHPEMKLTAINPGFVAGRPLDGNYGTSLAVIERFLSGKDPMVPDFGLPVVEVEDVAAMHLAALDTDESIGKRILAADRFVMMPELATHLAALHPSRRIATRVAPSLLVRAMALFDRELRSITPLLGERLEIDNARARRLFGMEFTPALDSVAAAAGFLLEREQAQPA